MFGFVFFKVPKITFTLPSFLEISTAKYVNDYMSYCCVFSWSYHTLSVLVKKYESEAFALSSNSNCNNDMSYTYLRRVIEGDVVRLHCRRHPNMNFLALQVTIVFDFCLRITMLNLWNILNHCSILVSIIVRTDNFWNFIQPYLLCTPNNNKVL